MKIMNFLFYKYRYVTMSVIILILLIGVIAVGCHFFSDNSLLDNESESADNESLSIISDSNKSEILAGDSTVLFVCNSKNIGDAIFIGLLDFHIFAQEIVLTPLNLSTSDGAKTYAESYSYGGIDSLINIVENVRKCQIDRYAIIDEEGICKLTDTFGKIKLYVSEDYTYDSSDKSYSVSAGYNDLEASMLYTYFEINSIKENGEIIIADIICTIINQYMSVSDLSQTHELFGELCNCITTNITIADYYTASDDIEYLIKNQSECIVSY